MRKLIVSIIIVLGFSCFTLAQSNSASVNETGNHNQGMVAQTGASNTANIDQNSYAGNAVELNSAEITQISSDNTAAIAQGSVALGKALKKAFASIMQETGDGNVAGIFQNDRGYATNFQRVSADVTQSGAANTATVLQFKFTSWVPEDNAVSIIQVGHDQQAWFKSSSNGFSKPAAGGSIDQTGFYNWAKVTQEAERDAVAHITQTNYTDLLSAQNMAEVYQRKDNGGLALVNQDGDANWLYLFQWNKGNADVNQVGNSNYSDIFQNGTSESVDLDQLSNYNTANLTQDGGGNSATVMQRTGDFNVVNLRQSAGSTADVIQDGANNTIMGLDVDLLATSLDGSTLNASQVGNSNVLHVRQLNGAGASVNQSGNLNIAVVSQN